MPCGVDTILNRKNYTKEIQNKECTIIQILGLQKLTNRPRSRPRWPTVIRKLTCNDEKQDETVREASLLSLL